MPSMGPGKRPAKPKQTVKSAANKRRMSSGTKARPSGGGINLPKFASEVSRNYAKGVARVGAGLNKVIPSRPASSVIPNTMKAAPSNRAALRKALGK